MASDFMDRFRFNTENAPDVFYIQNLKKKSTETFHEYATRWRSEAVKVRPALEEEQMNRFFVRAQDPQYYERLMLMEGKKFSDIIKLGERIEEGIKNGMVTNLEALQATNKALQSGGSSKKKDVNSVMVAQRNNSPMKYQLYPSASLTYQPSLNYQVPSPTYQIPPPIYQSSPPPTYQSTLPIYSQPAPVYQTYNAQPSHYQSPPTRQNFPISRPNFDCRPPRQYTAIAEPIYQLYEKLKAAGYVTPIPAVTPENPSQWINPNKTCAYHSGMKGHTIDECRSLKDKIQNLIDNKIIIAKEPTPNIRNNPLPDHKGGDIHMIEIEDDWDPEGSIGLIVEGDEPKKPAVTLNPIVVQIKPSKGDVVNVSISLEFEALSAKAPKPIEVEFGILKAPPPVEVTVLPPKVPIPVSMTDVTPFKTNAIPWDYTAEARRKGKTYTGEAIATQGITRTGRVYTPEHLAESSKQASGRVVETGPDDLWRKVQAKEYSVVKQLNKTPTQISILALLQSSEAHKNALMKILSEAYVPSNITGGEMANMVGQVLESHKITFHEDELPPEGLGHNKALHITAQCEDHFITRILVDGGSSLNICPLITLRTLGKGLHEVKDGAISVKAFYGSQRSTIGEISLCLQMGPTWFDVEFQVIDVPASYNLLLGRPWIHAARAVASTLHQAVKFEWNHQEVIIHGDGSNPIYSRQTILMIGGRIRIGGETYHHIEQDDILEEVVREVENFENRPKSNLDKTEVVNLGDTENVKETRISAHLSPSEKKEYTEFLKEYEDIFAWSYDDMTGLSTSIVAHKLPTDPTCPPVKQKLRKFKPDMSLKIKEEIWMDEEDAEKMAFIMPWGMYCYRMMPFGLENAGATYMRAMTTIFHNMIHKEI
ncbi:uncharacterized protein [Nicotiana sylvestris]|uniref:uncharacterized protein n=1 Tax=Nicotiana sylvestris TaxID=4096 RepID=UPI00388C7C0C